eukprot:TRINITY_DN11718_c0_g1_i2.p1 TRINITY_DN11718_c0_g1~~TRINITY_DN11718_c0_g1_i2.p1  ORF type:complete len:123 (-),score=34.03 TRINITY_DN11718_c0_g1_i2:338-706(-)
MSAEGDRSRWVTLFHDLTQSELITDVIMISPQNSLMFGTAAHAAAKSFPAVLSCSQGRLELFGHDFLVVASDDHRTTALTQHSKSGMVAQAIPFGTIVVLFHFPARLREVIPVLDRFCAKFN